MGCTRCSLCWVANSPKHSLIFAGKGPFGGGTLESRLAFQITRETVMQEHSDIEEEPLRKRPR